MEHIPPVELRLCLSVLPHRVREVVRHLRSAAERHSRLAQERQRVVAPVERRLWAAILASRMFPLPRVSAR
jgi:hypothetical protein